MNYFVYVENGNINGCGQVKILNQNVLNVQVDKTICDEIEKYIWDGVDVVLDPDYEQKQAQKERERIGNLTCTKRVFALMLQELGIDYLTVLKPLIESNPQAQLEWDLCVELQRSNPLLDIMANQLGVTPEQLDGLFRYANDEITIEEFRTLYVISQEQNIKNLEE